MVICEIIGLTIIMVIATQIQPFHACRNTQFLLEQGGIRYCTHIEEAKPSLFVIRYVISVGIYIRI